MADVFFVLYMIFLGGYIYLYRHPEFVWKYLSKYGKYIGEIVKWYGIW